MKTEIIDRKGPWPYEVRINDMPVARFKSKTDALWYEQMQIERKRQFDEAFTEVENSGG